MPRLSPHLITSALLALIYAAPDPALLPPNFFSPPLRLKLLERVSLHVGLVFIPIFASVAAGTLRIFGHAKSDATMLRAR